MQRCDYARRDEMFGAPKFDAQFSILGADWRGLWSLGGHWSASGPELG